MKSHWPTKTMTLATLLLSTTMVVGCGGTSEGGELGQTGAELVGPSSGSGSGSADGGHGSSGSSSSGGSSGSGAGGSSGSSSGAEGGDAGAPLCCEPPWSETAQGYCCPPAGEGAPCFKPDPKSCPPPPPECGDVTCASGEICCDGEPFSKPTCFEGTSCPL
jgi:hypothetical protein